MTPAPPPGEDVVLVEVTEENWRDIADLAPRDDQRAYVPALAARWLLLGVYGDTWHNLGAYAGQTPVGHVMWGVDTDGSRWVGGLLVDRTHQGRGLGRRIMHALLTRWVDGGVDVPIRLSVHPDNPARRLYESMGFLPTGAMEDDEMVLELGPRDG